MENPSNKSINGKSTQINTSVTPDVTSRNNYKPKYIKKFINIQEELIENNEFSANVKRDSSQACQSGQSGQTYLHSPVSLTEQNTLDIEGLMMKNKWR